MQQIYEICGYEIKPEIDNPQLQKVSYQKDGFNRWENYLSKNKIIVGNVKDFPFSERKILETHGIKSILVIPIIINQEWFGFIGFDYTKDEKAWSELDLNLLKI